LYTFQSNESSTQGKENREFESGGRKINHGEKEVTETEEQAEKPEAGNLR
jgi:hypothetical protein